MISLRCSNCLTYSETPIKQTGLPQGKTKKRLTEYASNCLLVLSSLLSGDGSTEIGKLLGLLDLQNMASFGSSAFPSIEYDLSGHIIQLTK